MWELSIRKGTCKQPLRAHIEKKGESFIGLTDKHTINYGDR